jgi:hypothetical protein
VARPNDIDEHDQEAAQRDLVRQMRASDRRAAEQGRQDDAMAEADQQRVDELRARQQEARIAQRAPRVGQQAADDGAGFLLGVLAWTLTLNYLRGGLPQAKGWLAAKFLNRPFTGTVAAPLKPTRPAAPG